MLPSRAWLVRKQDYQPDNIKIAMCYDVPKRLHLNVQV